MALKRSDINRSIACTQEVFAHFGIHLPPFAFWPSAQWLRQGREADEIRACMLGWDVTDFGSGDFTRIGRTLFTLRNGSILDPNYPKSYAEKYILDPEGQRAPAHFHLTKREDIINRGGGNILVELTRAAPDGTRSSERFPMQVDGQTRRLDPGSIIRLAPGQSLCIPPRTIHQFWGEEGTGYRFGGIGFTVSGEVSSVCDDLTDNFFLEAMTRFPAIEEDEPAIHYLCHEYPCHESTEACERERAAGHRATSFARERFAATRGTGAVETQTGSLRLEGISEEHRSMQAS